MFRSKLIFLTVALVIFQVNADKLDWKDECEKQLKYYGRFDTLSSREINYQTSPKAFLIDYLKELLFKFIEEEKNNLDKMFQDPMVWCLENIHKYRKDHVVPDWEKCPENMTGKKLSLIDTREAVLVGMFMKFRNDYSNNYIKGMQLDYYFYVGSCIENYIDYTSVRTPSEFCNGIESHAIPHSIDENGKIVLNPILQQEIYDQSNPNDPPTSSFNVVKDKALDIDLNQPPPDEDE